MPNQGLSIIVGHQEFFDEDRQITNLKPSDILEWKRNLQDYLAESTTASMLSKAKAVFNDAVKKGWLAVSPLQGIGRGSYYYSAINCYCLKVDDLVKYVFH